MEKYSVLMSIYIKENPVHFKESLESILNQTIKPDEVIIVRDGPLTDKLEKKLSEYERIYPNVIKVVVSKENIGLGRALNLGLQHCRNELVGRMDTDDISILDRFEKQLKVFKENPRLDIISGGIVEFIGNENNIVGRRILPTTDDEIRDYIKIRCPLNHVAVMFKKSRVIESGGYQEWHWNEDYYLWIRMYQNGAIFGNVDEDLVKVRVGSDMYKRRGGLKYFKSEFNLQKYMLSNDLIGYSQFIKNVLIRFVVQIMMPTKIRALFFQRFART